MITKLVVLGIYFAILFIIGIVASRSIKSLSDFYVGGKRIGYWAVAFSARATGESGWLLLGLTGMGAMAGFSAYWVVVGELLGVGISWFIMAKRFKLLSDKYQSITIPDFLESHFETKTHLLRKVAAAALSIFVIIYVSAQIDVTGKAFESLLNINYFTGAVIGFLIVLAYIYTGGFIAVVWSDFFQGLLMFFGLVALPIVAYFSIDSLDEFIVGLNQIDPNLTSVFGGSDDLWLTISTVLGFAMIGLGFLGSPQIYVRFLSIKNVAELDRGKWVAILFTLLTDFAAVSIGLIGRYLFTEVGQDPQSILGNNGEDVLLHVIEHYFPLFIIAIYIAVILSAIMSTIDSLLIVASSAIVRDVYQQILHPELDEKKMSRISRLVTLGMALFALSIAIIVAVSTPERTVFWFVIFGWSGIAATFCPVIILALFWPAYSEKGAIASMIVGFLSVPIFKFVVQNIDTVGIYFEKMDVLTPSFILAMLAGWIFTKVYPRQSKFNTSAEDQ